MKTLHPNMSVTSCSKPVIKKKILKAVASWEKDMSHTQDQRYKWQQISCQK